MKTLTSQIRNEIIFYLVDIYGNYRINTTSANKYNLFLTYAPDRLIIKEYNFIKSIAN